jgi:acyl-CoA reductase-like NAD-dependent aldehyde dehydrogenase
MTLTTFETDQTVAEHLPENSHFINGEWIIGDTATAIPVLNPSTGGVIHRIAKGDAATVDAAVAAARAAFPAWRDMNPILRADLMFKWADLVDSQRAIIERIAALEGGTPAGQNSSWKLPLVARTMAKLADKITGLTLPTADPDTLAMTVREPYGVVASIVPWNAPVFLAANDVAPAIAAGNTVVLKPASDAPLAVLYVYSLAVEAGIPAGVINIITGPGSSMGAALTSHPEVNKVSFTGSTEVGIEIMRSAAANITPVHLELGGKSATIILDDADLDKAIPYVISSFTVNCGQVCAAGSRLVVQKSIQDEVVRRLKEALPKVTIGPATDSPDMGPLISAKQLETVTGFIDKGKAEGAELVYGGNVLSAGVYDGGNFIEPTVFSNVSSEMTIAREEIFGPVLSIITAEDDDDAVRIANDSPYGLAAAVFSESSRRSLRLAKRLQAGTIGVNQWLNTGALGSPMGGYKQSGFGRTGGMDAVKDYTQEKNITVNLK